MASLSIIVSMCPCPLTASMTLILESYLDSFLAMFKEFVPNKLPYYKILVTCTLYQSPVQYLVQIYIYRQSFLVLNAMAALVLL